MSERGGSDNQGDPAHSVTLLGIDRQAAALHSLITQLDEAGDQISQADQQRDADDADREHGRWPIAGSCLRG